MILTLPLPLTVNHYYENATRRTSQGKVYMARMLSDDAQVYRREVWYAVKQARIPLQRARLSMQVLAQPADARQWDLDNRWKCLLDSLQHAGVFVNDSQFDELRIVRGPICDLGRVVVLIEQFDLDSALAPWAEYLVDQQARLIA